MSNSIASSASPNTAIITASTKRPSLTHFLCIPLITPLSRPQLRNSLKQFKDEVSETERDPLTNEAARIPAGAIRPIGTLHLTLGVMSLNSAERIEEVKRFVEGLDVCELLMRAATEPLLEIRDVVKEEDGPVSRHPARMAQESSLSSSSSSSSPPKSLVIDITSLEPMQSPTNTSILYAVPRDSSSRLLRFGTLLRDVFAEAGFLLPNPRPLKLHATIVNTVYVKGRNQRRKGGGGGGGHVRSREKGSRGIDAAGWIERWRGRMWAVGVRVERVAVCEMGAKKIVGERRGGGGTGTGSGSGGGSDKVVVNEEADGVGVGDAEEEVEDQEYREITSVALP
ncbi:hypothetical protein MMC25_005316 [Agyrium rufum]|nr:hypothetical protein [Agyrium rufum]